MPTSHPGRVPRERLGRSFADAYKAKLRAPTAIYAAEGYDAATVFIDAIKAGNTTA